MDELKKPGEYEKVFKPDRDLTIKVKLNKSVRDITLVIARVARVEAGDNMIVYETGFLKKKKNIILKKLFVRKIFKIFPFLKKIFYRTNKNNQSRN